MVFSRAIPAVHYGGTAPSGEKSPVNAAERRLRKMLLVAGFPEATSWQEQLQLGSGLGTTTPDAIYRPDEEDLRPVAIYLDGLSRHIHGNPETAERDRIIRAQLRETEWEVMLITAHELHDHGAMAKHFKALARYLDRGDLRSAVPERREWFEIPDDEMDADTGVAPPKPQAPASDAVVIPFELVPEASRKHYENCLPAFPDLRIAAGHWGDESGGFSQTLEGADDWVSLPAGTRAGPGCFVARVFGKSMEPEIPDGSWALFGPAPVGSRDNKRLIVWHASISDPDGMGRYTLKRYESEKVVMPDDAPEPGQHIAIKLHPRNKNYAPIELRPDEAASLRVVAEFLKVLL